MKYLILIAAIALLIGCEKPTYCWECKSTTGKTYFFYDLTTEEISKIENGYDFVCKPID